MSVRDGGRSPALAPVSPVTSGDNLWTMPLLVPCCEGKELQIDDECIRSGLSVISVRGAVLAVAPRRLACSSDTTPAPAQPTLKHRNSFRCVHRPELRRVPGLSHLSTTDLRLVFLTTEPGRLPCPHASPESRSELPTSMRLHRAHLFTAVLASAADPAACVTRRRSSIEDAQNLNAAADTTLDDETLAHEQIQIILRPQTDEETADCSTIG